MLDHTQCPLCPFVPTQQEFISKKGQSLSKKKKNRIFVLRLIEYVWFDRVKLILHSTLTFSGRECRVKVMASVTFHFTHHRTRRGKKEKLDIVSFNCYELASEGRMR